MKSIMHVDDFRAIFVAVLICMHFEIVKYHDPLKLARFDSC
jgi:hypothetical protein